MMFRTAGFEVARPDDATGSAAGHVGDDDISGVSVEVLAHRTEHRGRTPDSCLARAQPCGEVAAPTRRSETSATARPGDAWSAAVDPVDMGSSRRFVECL